MPARPPSIDSTTSRCFERRRIDQQAVGHLPQADRPDVREVGLLRVAQVAHQRAAGAHRGLPPLEAKALEPADAQLVEQGLARGFELEVPAVDLGDRHAVLLDLRQQGAGVGRRRPRQSRAAAARQSPRAARPGRRRREYSATSNSPVDRSTRATPYSRRVVRPPAPWPQSPSGTPARAPRGRPSRSACPGETTRTTSRLTTPLAFLGSSVCSQIATL